MRKAISWLDARANIVSFVLFHFLSLALVWWFEFGLGCIFLCGISYCIRMLGITIGYHRYFSHKSFKTSRPMAFILACMGASAMQKGPLWWPKEHREHHKHTDLPGDPHSPWLFASWIYGAWWSHVGWIFSRRDGEGSFDGITDFAKHWELRGLNRWHFVPGFCLALLCYPAGALLGISGWSGVVWGFLISTVFVYHATFCVNSVCHLFGRRRYETKDNSRNNGIVAFFTFGEGWHNNHHHYQSSARQGFFWWEIDVSYYVIRMLSLVGLVWAIRKPPTKKVIKQIAR